MRMPVVITTGKETACLAGRIETIQRNKETRTKNLNETRSRVLFCSRDSDYFFATSPVAFFLYVSTEKHRMKYFSAGLELESDIQEKTSLSRTLLVSVPSVQCS